jgi:formylglycine-generating enzyme required for sulfatase activity
MHAEMLKVLSTLDYPPSAKAFCKNLIDRAGLLVGYGEERKEYLFRHKTFREYLAGSQLTENIKRNSGMIAPLVAHFGEDWWNEPLTFFMAQADAAMFDRFMEELFDAEVSAEFSQKQQALLQSIIAEAPQKTTDALCNKLLKPKTSANRQRYILDCLKMLGKEEAFANVRYFLESDLAKSKDVISSAESVLSILSPDEMVSIGVSRVYNSINASDYILIPGGKYIYSQTEKEVSVPDIWFAKYPVTNRQYRAFIGFLGGKPSESAKSFTLKAYTEALHELARSGDEAVKGFDTYLKEESDLVKRFSSEREDDRKFNKDEQPVVGVSWFGARAYCLWLTLLSGVEYRLPTEAEWEWAAGGRREEASKVLKVKEYPWGDTPEPTPKYANYADNEGMTTPIGRYPNNGTPEGLYDMAGNVWEWIEDWFDVDRSSKALRGGSWDAIRSNLRCSARGFISPVLSYNSVGFRVIRSGLIF